MTDSSDFRTKRMPLSHGTGYVPVLGFDSEHRTFRAPNRAGAGPARAIDFLRNLRTKELKTKTYDAIVIGTGQAGPFLAQCLAGAGVKAAIIERKLFGGTCVNTGCTPTKTMIASAHAARIVRRAAAFGGVYLSFGGVYL